MNAAIANPIGDYAPMLLFGGAVAAIVGVITSRLQEASDQAAATTAATTGVPANDTSGDFGPAVPALLLIGGVTVAFSALGYIGVEKVGGPSSVGAVLGAILGFPAGIALGMAI